MLNNEHLKKLHNKKVGKVVITLDEYREAHGFSKNEIVVHANIQRTQLMNYCRNKVSRVDLGVLARICHYMQCDISDIMKYVPDDEI